MYTIHPGTESTQLCNSMLPDLITAIDSCWNIVSKIPVTLHNHLHWCQNQVRIHGNLEMRGVYISKMSVVKFFRVEMNFLYYWNKMILVLTAKSVRKKSIFRFQKNVFFFFRERISHKILIPSSPNGILIYLSSWFLL